MPSCLKRGDRKHDLCHPRWRREAKVRVVREPMLPQQRQGDNSSDNLMSLHGHVLRLEQENCVPQGIHRRHQANQLAVMEKPLQFNTINLAAEVPRDLGHPIDSTWQHGRRQLCTATGQQGSVLGNAFRADKGNQHRQPALVHVHHRHGVLDTLHREETSLHFTALNPDPVDLDLLIRTAEVHQGAIVTLLEKISSAVPPHRWAPSGRELLEEGLPCGFWQVQVAAGELHASEEQLAGGAMWHFDRLLVNDRPITTGKELADSLRPRDRLRSATQSCDVHGSFCGAICVEQHQLGKAIETRLANIYCASLAADANPTQRFKMKPVRLHKLQQLLVYRWNIIKCGHTSSLDHIECALEIEEAMRRHHESSSA
mmetsp:Transcript_101151/g.285185  ORF Transcript_101151/g.285185 Transcript_101151/m.285185 type:complete len:371 (+) Transcript_101151:954-2066(+)